MSGHESKQKPGGDLFVILNGVAVFGVAKSGDPKPVVADPSPTPTTVSTELERYKAKYLRLKASKGANAPETEAAEKRLWQLRRLVIDAEAPF